MLTDANKTFVADHCITREAGIATSNQRRFPFILSPNHDRIDILSTIEKAIYSEEGAKASDGDGGKTAINMKPRLAARSPNCRAGGIAQLWGGQQRRQTAGLESNNS